MRTLLMYLGIGMLAVYALFRETLTAIWPTELLGSYLLLAIVLLCISLLLLRKEQQKQGKESSRKTRQIGSENFKRRLH